MGCVTGYRGWPAPILSPQSQRPLEPLWPSGGSDQLADRDRIDILIRGAPAALWDFHDVHVQAHQARRRDADVGTLQYQSVATECVDELVGVDALRLIAAELAEMGCGDEGFDGPEQLVGMFRWRNPVREAVFDHELVEETGWRHGVFVEQIDHLTDQRLHQPGRECGLCAELGAPCGQLPRMGGVDSSFTAKDVLGHLAVRSSSVARSSWFAAAR
jgi:hypothetical protein